MLTRLLADDAVRPVSIAPTPANAPHAAPRPDIASITDDMLIAALSAHRWQVKPAAASLGIGRSTFYDLMDKSTRIRKAKAIPEAEVRGVVDACGDDLDAAAAELKVSRRALQLRLSEFGIRR